MEIRQQFTDRTVAVIVVATGGRKIPFAAVVKLASANRRSCQPIVSPCRSVVMSRRNDSPKQQGCCQDPAGKLGDAAGHRVFHQNRDNRSLPASIYAIESEMFNSKNGKFVEERPFSSGIGGISRSQMAQNEVEHICLSS
jgi:hypothetical protein